MFSCFYGIIYSTCVFYCVYYVIPSSHSFNSSPNSSRYRRNNQCSGIQYHSEAIHDCSAHIPTSDISDKTINTSHQAKGIPRGFHPLAVSVHMEYGVVAHHTNGDTL